MGNKSEIARQRNRERARARKLVHNRIGTDVFMAAQGFNCPICERALKDKPPGYMVPEDKNLSIDHVYDLATTRRHAGNLLLAHALCNMNKRDRHPTRAEQQMLGLVNRCLRYRKGIYKAALIGKGAKEQRIPEADFYQFCLLIINEIVKKVYIR